MKDGSVETNRSRSSLQVIPVSNIHATAHSEERGILGVTTHSVTVASLIEQRLVRREVTFPALVLDAPALHGNNERPITCRSLQHI